MVQLKTVNLLYANDISINVLLNTSVRGLMAE